MMDLETLLDGSAGYPPSSDGQVTVYTARSVRTSGAYSLSPKMVFVCGQRMDPETHRAAAVLLSHIARRPVVGVFNHPRTGNAEDVPVGAADTRAFAPLPTAAVARGIAAALGGPEATVELELSDSPAGSALHQLLMRDDYGNARIVAHEQGNLVTSAASKAIAYLRGEAGLRNLRIYALGSTVCSWPNVVDVRHYPHGACEPFSSLMAGRRIDPNWDTSPLVRDVRADLGIV